MLTPHAFKRLCRARDRLRESYEVRVPIDRIAKEAGLSTFHFIRLFHHVFGATPHQFRIQSQLDRAKQLLALSDYSVTDVCMEVGFDSLGSFSALFARRNGVPPSAYRRRIRTCMPARSTLPLEMTPGCLTLMARAFAIFEKHARADLADSLHEDQIDEHHGRQPGQGTDVLYGRLRFREED